MRKIISIVIFSCTFYFGASCFADQSIVELANTQYHVGIMHYTGGGGVKNRKLAAEYFIKSAQNGNKRAPSYLGLMYSKGDGVEQDTKKSFEWYFIGSERGDAECQYQLGNIYDNGLGVAQDNIKAIDWYSKSANQGFSQARNRLDHILILQKVSENSKSSEIAKTIEMSIKEAESGSAKCQFELGERYENGEGVKQDFKKAFEWYEKSASQGLFSAQHKIGVMYDEGKGVDKNGILAAEWFLKAAENLSAEAKYSVGVKDNSVGKYNASTLITQTNESNHTANSRFSNGNENIRSINTGNDRIDKIANECLNRCTSECLFGDGTIDSACASRCQAKIVFIYYTASGRISSGGYSESISDCKY